MATAEKEVLVELAERVGQELTSQAEQLRVKGTALKASITQQVEAAQASGIGPRLQEALTDLSALPEEKVNDKKLLTDLAFGAVTLAALQAGELIGRLLGGILFGFILSPAIAGVTTLLVLPASFIAYHQANSPNEQDRHLALALLGLSSGLLHGYALREYNLTNLEPECLLLAALIVLFRFGGGPLSKQSDRTPLLATIAGTGAILSLGIGLLTGTLGAASILTLALSTPIAIGLLQLYWAQGKAALCDQGQFEALIAVAGLTATLALDYALAPLAGTAGSE